MVSLHLTISLIAQGTTSRSHQILACGIKITAVFPHYSFFSFSFLNQLVAQIKSSAIHASAKILRVCAFINSHIFSFFFPLFFSQRGDEFWSVLEINQLDVTSVVGLQHLPDSPTFHAGKMRAVLRRRRSGPRLGCGCESAGAETEGGMGRTLGWIGKLEGLRASRQQVLCHPVPSSCHIGKWICI